MRAIIDAIDSMLSELLTLIFADIPASAALLIWNLVVVLLISKWAYGIVVQRKSHMAAAYFSRKVIHFLAGGLTALLVPFLCVEPFLPFVLGLLFAVMTYLPHKTGKLMDWFQVEDNIAEVYFCLAWSFLMLVMWYINIWLAVVPILFMSFGDGITGIVRNVLYEQRVKAWIGNLAMFALCAPIGYGIFGWKGVVAAILASLVEHYEFIDDNISVPLISWSTLMALSFI